MADDVRPVDGDEFDGGESLGAQVVDQLQFVGAAEGVVVESADRFIVRRHALADHHIVREAGTDSHLPHLPKSFHAVGFECPLVRHEGQSSLMA